MRDVSDAFLLNMAEVSAALIGLFIGGIFFFVDTGFRRLNQARGIVDPAPSQRQIVLVRIPSRSASRSAWSRCSPSGARCCSRC